MRLSGKTALITGGSSGIGLETAKLFVSEGARVAVTGQDPERLRATQEELGDDALCIEADVRRSQDMEAASRRVLDVFGGLDIFFGNAGKARGGALADIDEDAYDDLFDTNVKGIFLSMKTVASIIRAGGSVILNTSFIVHRPMKGLTLLAASKAAVRAMAEGWAQEFVAREIRVNTVCPGYIETPLHSKVGGTSEEVASRKANFARSVPLKRMGASLDVAQAVLFLASDESSYITAIEIVVDGGMSRL